MKSGLLWYDGDPKRPLETKVRRAIRRYHLKFEYWPNTCFVHPCHLQQEPVGMKVAIQRPGPSKYVPPVVVRVLASPTTLKNHFWVGREEEA